MFHLHAGVLATHLLHEAADHLHEALAWAEAAAASKATTTAMAAAMTASASAESESAAFLTSASRLFGGLSSDFLALATEPLLSFLLCLRSTLGEHVDEDIGSTSVLSDLEHWVLIWKAFFAEGAQVEVFADGTLVTDALDWFDSAAVASDVEVNDIILWVIVELVIFVLGEGSAEVLALEELTEDLLALGLELIVDEVLESFAWDALLAILLALSFDTLGWAFVFAT